MHFCFNAHPLARLSFGLGMLALVLMQHALQPTLLLIFFLSCLLRLLHGSFGPLLRLFRLLRWFLLPILLMHAFFTPGELLTPAFPLTWEGIHQGILISAHLIDLFLAAMLLAGLLRQCEWFAMLAAVPMLDKRVWEYVIMLSMMNLCVRSLLGQINEQWKLRKNWSAAPVMLISAFRQAIERGREQARAAWLRWPGHAADWLRSGMIADQARIDVSKGNSVLLNSALLVAGLAEFMVAFR